MSVIHDRSWRLACASALLACAAGAPPSALAQDSDADSLALDEVVVTARKREESLQDVPLSITAFSAESLEQRGVESIYDVARRLFP